MCVTTTWPGCCSRAVNRSSTLWAAPYLRAGWVSPPGSLIAEFSRIGACLPRLRF
jgi:hypothetical protein